MVALFMAMRSLGLSLCDPMAARPQAWPLLLGRDERRRRARQVGPRLPLRMFDETRDGRARRQRLCAGLLFAIYLTHRRRFEVTLAVHCVWWPGGMGVSR
jgi:hypothetical protein